MHKISGSRKEMVFAVAGLVVGSLAFCTGCKIKNLRAVVAGIDRVARALEQSGNDNDMSFGEWLASELDD